MNQSFDTQLQVVLRALGETVLPALGGAEKHVVEQLQLSMVALDCIRQRLPHAGRFYRGELAAYVAQADAVAALIDAPSDIDQLRAHADAGRAALQNPAADWADYVDATRTLRETIADVAERSAGSSFEATLDKLVLATASDLHLQSRVWCQPFGFELRPEDLPAPTWG